MKNYIKPNTEERPVMIILGIFTLYFLITGFIFYLYFLHRIHIIPALITTAVFTIIYLPQFWIIKKLKTKDKIKIIDDYIMINDIGVNFEDIVDFRVNEFKPKLVFFFNNKMIIFKEAIFHLRTRKEEFHFNVIGSEKITLLKQYLENILK